MQQWQGRIGDQPIQLTMNEKSRTQTGPDIQKMLDATMAAARGDLLGAVSKMVDTSNQQFDAQMHAMKSQVQDATGYSGEDMARDGSLLTLLLGLGAQAVAAERSSKREVDLAKQIPAGNQA